MSIVRPTGGYPGWASGTSGAAAITQPDPTTMAEGWQANQAPPHGFMNWLQNLAYQWIGYLDAIRGPADLFGDGSDGDFTLDGATGPLWATGPSGFTYLAVRDVLGRNISVASGVELRMGGYRLYATQQLLATGSARITQNGVSGGSASGNSGGAWGSAAPAGSIGGGGTGGHGYNTAGIAQQATGVTGTSLTNSFGGTGGMESVGGNAGGNAIRPSGAQGSPRLISGPILGHLVGGGSIAMIQGGGGGAGGANGNSGAGGGGGGGGGVLAIAARSIVMGPTSIQVFGGRGGDASGSGSDGGNGGGGGVAILAYIDKPIGVTFTADLCCHGGSVGGRGLTGGAGVTGTSGLVGSIFEIPLGGF